MEKKINFEGRIKELENKLSKQQKEGDTSQRAN
jgi:uncharacterized coiled-coil protein SlyX